MKSKMVQELLIKALINQYNNARPAEASANGAHVRGNTPNTQSELVKALLKSLYLNNSPKQNISNIKKTNTPIKNIVAQTQVPQGQKVANAIEKFIQKEPNFFKERGMLQEYLENEINDIEDAQLEAIVNITKELEKTAIKRFCEKNPKYAEFLKEENKKTLNKLDDAYNREIGGELKTRQTFTQGDIEKMSDEDFLKHKNDIDAQLSELLKGI